MIRTFIIFLLANLATSSEKIDIFIKPNSTSGQLFNEYLLCRGCGNEITFSSSIISKLSPSSYYSFYDSLFKKDKVLIQIFLSDFFLPYSMITTSQSHCIAISEWEEVDSWFPGYQWKPCICPDCGALVGWVFEPVNFSFVDQPAKFFGLILSTLIGESSKYKIVGFYSFWFVGGGLCFLYSFRVNGAVVLVFNLLLFCYLASVVLICYLLLFR